MGYFFRFNQFAPIMLLLLCSNDTLVAADSKSRTIWKLICTSATTDGLIKTKSRLTVCLFAGEVMLKLVWQLVRNSSPPNSILTTAKHMFDCTKRGIASTTHTIYGWNDEFVDLDKCYLLNSSAWTCEILWSFNVMNEFALDAILWYFRAWQIMICCWKRSWRKGGSCNF